MKKLISMLLVLVMCTLALTSCGGVNGSPEAVVEAMLEVMTDYDVGGLKDLLPDDAWDELYEEMDVDEDEFWEDLEDEAKDMKEELEENKDKLGDDYDEQKEALDKMVVGKSGKMVWMASSKDAVKAAK